MSHILISDIPEDVLSEIDGRAARLGLARSEYVRRLLIHDAGTATISVPAPDLRAFGSDHAARA